MNYNAGTLFVRDKQQRLTCRGCGRAPYYCWHCRAPTCLTCSDLNPKVCSCCKRLP